MNPTVLATMARQRGLITRKQALLAGVDEGHLDRLVRSGAWTAVRRGVYVESAHWDSLDPHGERELLRGRAASMRMTREHVLSHATAARELGMQILRPRGELVHVTRPGVLGSRTDHGVKHHSAPYHPRQVTVVDEFHVLDRARVAVDIAREEGLQAGVCAADSALRAGVSRRDLERAVDPVMRSWRHVRVVRDAVALARPGADSIGETLGRLLVSELGLELLPGEPETQFGLHDQGRVAWCDLRVGRHIFEFDGRVKYLPVASGGIAERSPEEVVWDEKLRQDWVCGFKLGMSRIVWDDFWGERRQQAKMRLRREYAETVSRFGTDITDLAPYIIRRPRG